MKHKMITQHPNINALFIALLSTAAISPTYGHDDEKALDKLVVTTGFGENDADHSPISVSVINHEEIQANMGSSLDELIKDVVGLEVFDGGDRGGRKELAIRGVERDYNLILINGRRVSSNNAIFRGNDFDLSMVPKNSIERIEVVRGPMSALYGSDALGGVINILTKQPSSEDEWSTSIASSIATPESDGGSEFTIGLNGSGALIDDKLYVSYAIQQLKQDSWTPYKDELSNVTAIEDQDVKSLFSSIQYLINDSQSILLDFSLNDDQRKNLSKSDAEDGITTPGHQKVNRNRISITHDGTWSFGNSQIGYTYENVDVKETEVDDNSQSSETNEIFFGNVTLDYDEHSLVVGGEIKNTELEDKEYIETPSGSEDKKELAVFVQDKWSLSEDLSLTTGVRLDNHEDFGNHSTPRIYLVNNITNNWILKGGVSTAFKAPKIMDVTPGYVVESCRGDCYIVGNPDLKPETSTNYELSSIYAETDFRVEFTLYRNEIKDLIDTDEDNPVGDRNGTPIITSFNIEKVLTQGLEFSSDWEMSRDISLNLNYTYTSAKNETSGTTLNNIAKHNTSVSANWYINEELKAYVTARRKDDIIHDDDYFINDITTVDLGFSYDVSKDLYFSGGISNLSDVQYSDDIYLNGSALPGRTFTIAMSLEL